jgi:fatty acid-binding protein DegV
MADTFNIKPVLTVREGKLDLLEKIRTWNKAVNRLFDLVGIACQGKVIERVAIIHVNNPEEALKFKETISQSLNYTGPVIIAPFTPGLSVHAGAGVVGVVIMTRYLTK